MGVFFSSPSVFGRLRNPVLFIPSFENGRFRRPSKPSAPRAGRLRKDSRSEEGTLECEARIGLLWESGEKWREKSPSGK